MKYFHELTLEERNKTSGMPYGELWSKYKQPEWCVDPNALHHKWGCYSLMSADIEVNEEFCKNCIAYLKKQ